MLFLFQFVYLKFPSLPPCFTSLFLHDLMMQLCDSMSQTVIAGQNSFSSVPQDTALHLPFLLHQVCSGEQSDSLWQARCDSTTGRDCIESAMIARMMKAVFIFEERVSDQV